MAVEDLGLKGDLLIDFGLQPVSNRFLSGCSEAIAPHFPLQLRIDTSSGLIHLGTPFPVSELKPRYDWVTAFEPEDHLDDLVDRILALPDVTKDTVFGAYSFKDDSMLERLKRKGYRRNWRIDPKKDLGVTDPCANIETFQHAFTLSKARAIRARSGGADVMIVRHVIEHSYDLDAFISSVRELLNPNGYIVWELPDCSRALDAGDCTSVWEEHIYYFTRFTFEQLMRKHFEIVHYDVASYVHEDSLVAIVREGPIGDAASPDPNAVAEELTRGKAYARIIADRKCAVRESLERIRATHGPIAIFGAAHLSVTFLSILEVADLISIAVDDNPNKIGLRMPVGGLQVFSSAELYSGRVGVCLLGLNPQNQPLVLSRHANFQESGGVFASIFCRDKLYLEHL